MEPLSGKGKEVSLLKYERNFWKETRCSGVLSLRVGRELESSRGRKNEGGVTKGFLLPQNWGEAFLKG